MLLILCRGSRLAKSSMFDSTLLVGRQGLGQLGFRVVGQYMYPQGHHVLLWGILPQIIRVIPDIETLHSTMYLLRTLWGKVSCIRKAPQGTNRFNDPV